MSSKVEVSRELAEYAAALLEQHCQGNVSNELRTLLAAPAVERLTAAEQRNAAILGKQTKCKECGSDALFALCLLAEDGRIPLLGKQTKCKECGSDWSSDV